MVVHRYFSMMTTIQSAVGGRPMSTALDHRCLGATRASCCSGNASHACRSPISFFFFRRLAQSVSISTWTPSFTPRLVANFCGSSPPDRGHCELPSFGVAGDPRRTAYDAPAGPWCRTGTGARVGRGGCWRSCASLHAHPSWKVVGIRSYHVACCSCLGWC